MGDILIPNYFWFLQPLGYDYTNTILVWDDDEDWDDSLYQVDCYPQNIFYNAEEDGSLSKYNSTTQLYSDNYNLLTTDKLYK